MKEKRSLMLRALTVFLAIGVLMAGVPVTASATEINVSAPLMGDGTEESPYEISNKEELYWFAQLVNGELEGVAQNKKANAILVNDITVNEKVLENGELVSDVSGLIEWKPIASNYGGEYRGTFDGKGYTISGLYCDLGSVNAGVFGNVSWVVNNLNVTDSYFCSYSATGGICGFNSGFLNNCNASAVVEGAGDGNDVGGIAGVSLQDIYCCSFTGEVRGKEYVGGICGRSDGTIRDCKNTGSVTGDRYVGGIGGFLGAEYDWDGTNRNYNAGDVKGRTAVGGVFGLLDSSTYLYNSYNTGSVTATESGAGGILGESVFSDLTMPMVYNCYNSGKVYAPVYSGAFSGSNGGGGVFGKGNFYLKGSAIDGGGYEQTGIGKSSVGANGGYSSCVTEITQSDLESGRVAYLLQRNQDYDDLVWGQIDYSTGAHPILTNNEAYRVDKYTNINGTTIYISGGTGDFDNDKVIDENDYDVLIKSVLGEADNADEETFAKSDVNDDGVLDVLDVALFERKISR